MTSSIARYSLAAVLLASTAFACAPSRAARSEPDARTALVRKVHRQYPPDAYLVGIASGATSDEAETRARADAASQLQSELQSRLDSEQSETNGRFETAVVERLSVKVETDAFHLMRALPQFTVRDGALFHAAAVASRADIDAKYAAEAQRTGEQLGLAWKRALENEHAAPTVAATALCEADRLEKKLDELDLARRALAHRSAWTEALFAQRSEVRQLRSRQREAQVLIDRGDAELAVLVADRTLQRLQAAGLPGQIGTDAQCTDERGYVVRIEPRERCETNRVVGEICQVSLVARGQACGTHTTLFEETSGTTKGLHASDGATALRLARREFERKKLPDSFAVRVASRLSDALGGVGGGCGQ